MTKLWTPGPSYRSRAVGIWFTFSIRPNRNGSAFGGKSDMATVAAILRLRPV